MKIDLEFLYFKIIMGPNSWMIACNLKVMESYFVFFEFNIDLLKMLSLYLFELIE